MNNYYRHQDNKWVHFINQEQTGDPQRPEQSELLLLEGDVSGYSQNFQRSQSPERPLLYTADMVFIQLTGDQRNTTQQWWTFTSNKQTFLIQLLLPSPNPQFDLTFKFKGTVPPINPTQSFSPMLMERFFKNSGSSEIPNRSVKTLFTPFYNLHCSCWALAWTSAVKISAYYRVYRFFRLFFYVLKRVPIYFICLWEWEERFLYGPDLIWFDFWLEHFFQHWRLCHLQTMATGFWYI